MVFWTSIIFEAVMVMAEWRLELVMNMVYSNLGILT